MTAQEIIEKIRAEIERHKELFKEACDSGSYYACARRDEANAILEALSDLEKEEKPSEGLEEEYKDYVESDPVYGKLVNRNAGLSIARHFAQWGAEHAKIDVTDFCKPIDPGIAQCVADHFWEMLGEDEKPVPKDLESYAQKIEDYYDVGEERGYLCVHRGGVKEAVIAGAKWQKEQMMRSAVEARVFNVMPNRGVVMYEVYYPNGVPHNDRGVIGKLIFVKEEQK